MNDTDTIVLINKPEGVTSFKCLNNIKKIVNKKTGHCGTLDKFASGLMIVLCGRKYTKLNEKFMGLDKTYLAKIEFGKETETLDPEGQIIATAEIPSLDTIKDNVSKLLGEISQIPPIYSALHVNGKRSYDLARNGVEVNLNPRKIYIYSADIISFNAPYLEIRLHVSKGTYIRSYARDLALLCNSRGYLVSLKRESIGPFSLDDSIDADNIEKLSLLTEDNALPIIRTLENYKYI